jgi:tRNA modification GTPase
VLVNKIDLNQSSSTPHSESRDGVSWLWASAKTGAGLDALREHLKQLAGAGSGEGAFSARRRHVLALQQVSAHLDHTALLARSAAPANWPPKNFGMRNMRSAKSPAATAAMIC